jgi:tripartite-type tricarboxylate transporter receptor subunit TctC
MFTKTGSPSDAVRRLNAEINKATQVPDVAQRMAAIGIVPNNMSVEESTRFYLAEVERWKDVVNKAKIEPVN